MSKGVKKNKISPKAVKGFSFVREHSGVFEYILLKNNLTVLYKQFPGTGVVTTNITYKVGARDEGVGETGIAHMLEHMLFKPTKADLRSKTTSGAMRFERDTGCTLNANTCKDRTTYFFCYPVEHFKRAIKIEAERMTDVVLTNKEFEPERGNVLSEFDMYFGEPKYALGTAMATAAFQSHPYGHETIGFREDIERYTVEKLDCFYRQHYRPDNATLMVMGDIGVEEALSAIQKTFDRVKNPKQPISRHVAIEPKQEGLRRTEIVRDSNTNMLAIGVKHAGFPSQEWVDTLVLFHVLAGGSDSLLSKLLIDTGQASLVEYLVEPVSETNLGALNITLAKGVKHADIEKKVLKVTKTLTRSKIAKDVQKAVASILTEEMFNRDGSLKTAMSLTEGVAAGDWTSYFEVVKKLKKVTPEKIARLAEQLFKDSNLTIGSFIGTK